MGTICKILYVLVSMAFPHEGKSSMINGIQFRLQLYQEYDGFQTRRLYCIYSSASGSCARARSRAKCCTRGSGVNSCSEMGLQGFNSMLKYAEAQGTFLVVPQEGDVLQLGGATVTILHCWPEAIDYGRTNDSSIVTRIDYGKTSFIITGDAEDWSEYMMIDSGMSLKANVLRVSHHGSFTGTTSEFLIAVQPDFAVIFVDKGNGYGHPHQEVLDRLKDAGAKVLRTDRLGTIVMESNGENLVVWWHHSSRT